MRFKKLITPLLITVSFARLSRSAINKTLSGAVCGILSPGPGKL